MDELYELTLKKKALQEELEMLNKKIAKARTLSITSDYFEVVNNNQGKKDEEYYQKFPYQLKMLIRGVKLRTVILAMGTSDDLADKLEQIEQSARELKIMIRGAANE